MRPIRTLLVALSISVIASVASGQPVSVAAASDLQAALPAIAAGFERQTGQRVALTFGSSGNLFTQVQNGAPFDVFLSADIDYPRRLEQNGAIVPGSFYEYAQGRLVVWTRRDSGIDLKGGLSALALPAVRRVAIANPDHAPYGRAALAALRREGLYERVQPKLVRGENISQAAQFVQSGNADAGLLALSIALSPAMKGTGTFVELPDSLYPPIQQAVVVLAGSRQRAAAQQFVAFLKTDESTRILQSYGFVLPARAHP